MALELQLRSDAAVVFTADEDANLVPSRDLVRLDRETYSCPAVRKRKDIIERKVYNNFTRVTNHEQYEMLREISRRV
ncbi:hypothetical protein MRX96_045790 [Rhipicephalus microplus]